MFQSGLEDFGSIEPKGLQKINIYLDLDKREIVWDRDKVIEIDRRNILMKR